MEKQHRRTTTVTLHAFLLFTFYVVVTRWTQNAFLLWTVWLVVVLAVFLAVLNLLASAFNALCTKVWPTHRIPERKTTLKTRESVLRPAVMLRPAASAIPTYSVFAVISSC